MIDYSEESLKTLNRFYQALQPDIDRLETAHASKMQCKKGCHACCIDDLVVFGVEAANIIKHYSALVQNEKPHPKGKCAFLNKEGACRIYNVRPFVCRTQGLPLKIINQKGNELRDVCPLNLEGVNLNKIPEKQLLHTNPYEEFLARLQLAVDKGQMERIKLRSLFGEK
ncbi:MAG: YkgJ family cysteine cluster protein [Flavobacteriales bacterium]